MENESADLFDSAHTANVISTVASLSGWDDYTATYKTHRNRTWFTDLEVETDIVLNGTSLNERLNLIERLLNIPKRDLYLEAKYSKLAEIYQEYMKEVEKLTTYEKLKGSTNE